MSRIFPPSDDAVSFRGRTIWLEPAGEQHRELIRPLAKDERIWEFTKTLMINDSYDQQFDQYFDEALALAAIGEQAFIIHAAGEEKMSAPDGISIEKNAIIGMTRIFLVDWKFRRMEIGHTWYIPAVWGKVYNKECKLMLLQYAFEHLRFHRVQFSVAHQNIRSQKAVEKIGGVKEGVLRKYAIRNDGSRRDTVMFSIIDDEWPEKKARLLQLIQE